MTNLEIEKEKLDKKVNQYEKIKNFRNKEELNNATLILIAQIQRAREVNIINNIMVNEYIVRLKTKYKDMIQKKQMQEYKEQVLNFNDDFVTSKERVYMMKEQEKKSIEEWKKELEKKATEDSSASAMHEKEENIRDKESEREA